MLLLVFGFPQISITTDTANESRFTSALPDRKLSKFVFDHKA